MMSLKDTCPICGEGHLEPKVDKNLVEYGGISILLDSQYSVCDLCCSEQASPDQTQANKRQMLAFIEFVDAKSIA